MYLILSPNDLFGVWMLNMQEFPRQLIHDGNSRCICIHFFLEPVISMLHYLNIFNIFGGYHCDQHSILCEEEKSLSFIQLLMHAVNNTCLLGHIPFLQSTVRRHRLRKRVCTMTKHQEDVAFSVSKVLTIPCTGDQCLRDVRGPIRSHSIAQIFRGNV